MADYTIFPTGLTYSRNTKAPLMDMQVFETLALAQAYVDNKDQTAYVGLTVSVVNDGANNGLYYVNQIADADHATGVLTKVGADAAQDVADLKAAVEALETAVGDENSGIAADVAANAAAIEKKADIFNVGNGLSYSENKIINIVVSSAAGNSLSVDENGLYVAVPEVEVPEYSLDSVASPAEAYAAQYEFKKDGVVLNTINIPKDQFLKSASYDDVNNKLVFVFNTSAGETTNEVDVADLVDTYTAGSYISITDSAISVDYESLKAQIKVDLVDSIAARVGVNEGAITVLQTSSEDHGTRIGVLETAKTDLEARIVVLEGVEHPAKADVDQLKLDVSGLQTSVSGLDTAVKAIHVKNVDKTKSNGINLTLDDAGVVGINVDITELSAAVVVNHEVKTSDVIVSAAIGDSYTESDTLHGVLSDLDQRINSIDSDIQSALEGGVTGINAGNGIIVTTEIAATKPTVSLKLVEGSALRATTDGLNLVWEQI